MLDPEHIDRFKTLILPNIAALSTQQCDQLRAFVEQGGSLVATYETSLYDEWGVRRNDFGLASLFGTSFAGGQEGPTAQFVSVTAKRSSTRQFHHCWRALKTPPGLSTALIRVTVTPLDGAGYSPLQLVPSYPDLPMEEVFTRPVKTRRAGRAACARSAAAAWFISLRISIAHSGRCSTWTLRSCCAMQCCGPPTSLLPVTVEGKGVLDISVWGQKNSMTVHLVNLTNPMMMKGPLREVIPLPDQQLRIRIPAGRRVTRARLLVAGGEAPYRPDGGFDSPRRAVHRSA